MGQRQAVVLLGRRQKEGVWEVHKHHGVVLTARRRDQRVSRPNTRLQSHITSGAEGRARGGPRQPSLVDPAAVRTGRERLLPKVLVEG